MQSEDNWDPNVYSKFIHARTRPARDLLSAINPSSTPNLIYDLGCGTGNTTVLLKHRWPNAEIVGIDNSDSMLQSAKFNHPSLKFLHSDIISFTPTANVDIFFANASLQWVNNHPKVISQLVSQLSTPGLIAIQMPNNFHSPAYQAVISLLFSKKSWQPLLAKLLYPKLNQPLYQANDYYRIFAELNLSAIDLWETEYFLIMKNHQAIFEWMRGTVLLPILPFLKSADYTEFQTSLIEHFSHAYKENLDGNVLFSFRRIFMIGTKTSL